MLARGVSAALGIMGGQGMRLSAAACRGQVLRASEKGSPPAAIRSPPTASALRRRPPAPSAAPTPTAAPATPCPSDNSHVPRGSPKKPQASGRRSRAIASWWAAFQSPLELRSSRNKQNLSWSAGSAAEERESRPRPPVTVSTQQHKPFSKFDRSSRPAAARDRSMQTPEQQTLSWVGNAKLVPPFEVGSPLEALGAI